MDCLIRETACYLAGLADRFGAGSHSSFLEDAENAWHFPSDYVGMAQPTPHSPRQRGEHFFSYDKGSSVRGHEQAFYFPVGSCIHTFKMWIRISRGDDFGHHSGLMFHLAQPEEAANTATGLCRDGQAYTGEAIDTGQKKDCQKISGSLFFTFPFLPINNPEIIKCYVMFWNCLGIFAIRIFVGVAKSNIQVPDL